MAIGLLGLIIIAVVIGVFVLLFSRKRDE